MKCPSCGAENPAGKYCAECGAGLNVSCAACGAAVGPGSRFCTACGEPVSAGRGVTGSRTPWIIAAAALLVVVLVLFLPRQADRAELPPARSVDPSGSGVGAPGGGMPALSSDMRENADRLFNRIMMAAQRGDRAQVDQFMPMAVQAYEMVEELDDDGLYHLAILHQTAGEYGRTQRTAEQILDRSPNHILALGVAAAAAEEAGDSATALGLWQRLLGAYPEEVGRPLPEYMDHEAMLEEYRDMAREATRRQ